MFLITLCGYLLVYPLASLFTNKPDESLNLQSLEAALNGVPEICSKFTGEHPGRSVISVNLLCNFIEISLWYGCFSVTFIRTPIEGCCFGCNEYFFVRTRRIMIFMEYHLKGNVTIRKLKVISLIKKGSGTFFVIDFKI